MARDKYRQHWWDGYCCPRRITNNSILGLQSLWCNILPSIRYSIVSDCRRMRHGPNEASCWSKIDLDTFKQIRRRSDRRFYSF